jgi:antitoxin component of RelBE/YafQ-DinJ toxin-antitoxin module
MNTKLTLKLDEEVIEKAKAYAERQGVSLSRMVESYFSGLTKAEEAKSRPTGLVAELAGLLTGVQVEDEKSAYAEYLTKKYS